MAIHHSNFDAAQVSGGPAVHPRWGAGLGRLVRWAGLGLGLFAVVLGGLLALLPRESPPPYSAGRGQTAPELALTDQAGQVHHLSDYRGRVVLLAFAGAGEKDAAVGALRSLRDTTGEIDHLGLKVFGVSSESPQALRRLHGLERLPFPLLSDPEGRLAAAYARLTGRPAGQPESVVVGPEGKIQASIPPEPGQNHAQTLVEWSRCCVARMLVSSAKHVPASVPNVPLPVAEGESSRRETLYGDRKQVATLVVFLSSRCPCSQAYNDRVLALTRELSPSVVRIVGVYANADESTEECREHFRRNGFRFRMVRDEHRTLADRFGARVTPEAFLLDSHGQLRYHGRIDDSRNPEQVTTHELRDALTAVISGMEPPRRDTPAFGCAITRSR